MDIIGKNELKEFAKAHSKARKPLARWIDITEQANWSNLEEVKNSFSAVDYIPVNQYCFNIGGNNFRLLTAISFSLSVITVIEIMTHEEYSKKNLNMK